MELGSITLERQGDRGQCGTLAFRDGARAGWLLFVVQMERGRKVTVEFVPGLGAHQSDVTAHYELLVDGVVQKVFEQISRKSIFRSH